MIEYKTTKDISANKLNNLFASIGWKSRSEEKWLKVLRVSSIIVSAWKGDELVGLGRIMEDGVMCMFYDIGVHPNHQKQGIGTRLMELLANYVKDREYTSIGLFVWDENPSVAAFYQKFGFEQVNSGMELVKYMERE
jgi:ribosomal protein S18 acetylase RimI-like enzyme